MKLGIRPPKGVLLYGPPGEPNAWAVVGHVTRKQLQGDLLQGQGHVQGFGGVRTWV